MKIEKVCNACGIGYTFLEPVNFVLRLAVLNFLRIFSLNIVLYL